MRQAVRIIKSEKGQQTVEFLLMMGVVVSCVLAFVFTFHKQLAGGFFTIIGNILN